MTSQSTQRSQNETRAKKGVVSTENPTRSELKDSLEQAEFPRAAHMAKEALGEDPRRETSKNQG